MRVLVVAVAIALAPVVATAQSLGDAAKRQAQQRSTVRHPAKVFTDTDLQGKGAVAETVTPETPGGGGPVTGDPSALPTTTPAPEDTRAQLEREEAARHEQERYWSQLASGARRRVEAAQRAYDESCGRALVLVGG